MRDESTVAIDELRSMAVSTATPLQLELANAIVHAHKELFGRGPTKARVTLNGELVVCVLTDCMTVAERTLVRSGRSESVALLRRHMHVVARPMLTRIVEELTGHGVTAVTSGVDADADQNVITFTLDRPLVSNRPRAAGTLRRQTRGAAHDGR